MSDSPIGIIDSGLGGLSVWESIRTAMPHESTVYIGDHGNSPYGKRTIRFIRNRVTTLIGFLLQKRVKLVVVACNTATVAGIDYYRSAYPTLPIVGVVPVVKTAATVSKKRSFAILSTKFTANSRYQKDLIKKFAGDCAVYNLGCPNLVSFIEKGEFTGKEIEKELRMLLRPTEGHIDVIALGCTHFPFLKNIIHAIVGKDVQILDSGGAVARQVGRILEHNKSLTTMQNPVYTFFTTGDSKQVAHATTKLIGKPMDIQYAAI